MGLHDFKESPFEILTEFLQLRFPGYTWEPKNKNADPMNTEWRYKTHVDGAWNTMDRTNMVTWQDSAKWWAENGKPMNGGGGPMERWEYEDLQNYGPDADNHDTDRTDPNDCDHENGHSEDGYCYDCDKYDEEYDQGDQMPL